MNVQALQNTGMKGTQKGSRLDPGGPDSFMEVLNTRLEQSAANKPRKMVRESVSQPVKTDRGPLNTPESAAEKAAQDAQEKNEASLSENPGRPGDTVPDRTDEPAKEQAQAAAGILAEEQLMQNGWEILLPDGALSRGTGGGEEMVSGILQPGNDVSRLLPGTEENLLSAAAMPAGDFRTAEGKKTGGRAEETPEKGFFLKSGDAMKGETAGGLSADRTVRDGQEASGEGTSSYGDVLKEQSRLLKDLAGRGKEETQTETADSPANREPDTDALQKKVDEKAWLPMDRMIAVRAADRPEITAASGTKAEAVPVMQQVKTGLEEGMAKGMNHFTIRLKPEGLGEIVVRMVTEGGKISMRIGVSNEETQRLINSELLQLKEALQPLNAQVQEVYHSGFGGMDSAGYQQDMYRQQRQMNGMLMRRYGGTQAGEEEDTSADIPVYSRTDGRLYAYI